MQSVRLSIDIWFALALKTKLINRIHNCYQNLSRQSDIDT